MLVENIVGAFASRAVSIPDVPILARDEKRDAAEA